MTEVRIPISDVSPTRSVSPDMFADLGVTTTATVDAADLVLSLAPSVTAEQETTVRLALTTRDDAEAATIQAAADGAATAGAWTPTGTTEAQQIADLREQVSRLTTLCCQLAQLVIANRA